VKGRKLEEKDLKKETDQMIAFHLYQPHAQRFLIHAIYHHYHRLQCRQRNLDYDH
jgi:ATP-dependent protease Clp ATPase subunit